MTDEQRLIELEIKFAYQEDLLQELNAVVVRQQKEINRLQNICKILATRMESLNVEPGVEELHLSVEPERVLSLGA